MAIVSPGTPRMTPMALKFGEPPVYKPAAIAASCRPHGKPAPSVRPKTTTTALTASSRSANEMSTSNTMCGTPIIRSIIQLTTASTRLPPSAAAQPRINAITDDTPAASKPTSTLVDNPASVRASMSRPIQSVPNG